MLDIFKIRAVLDEASKWDMDYKAFGSEVHLHLLRQPLPLRELEAWDEQIPWSDSSLKRLYRPFMINHRSHKIIFYL